jgi:extracellular elastinolytic metalloproteinase
MRASLRLLLLTALVPFTFTLFAQDAEVLVRQYLKDRAATKGLSAQEAEAWTVTSRHTDRKGLTYLYIQQTVNGLPVAGAVANFAVREGRVVAFGDRLQVGLAQRATSAAPAMDAEAALRLAATELGLAVGDVRVLSSRTPSDLMLSPSGVSHDPIPARLVYMPLSDGSVRLAWDLTIRSVSSPNWWHVLVDASTGDILRTTDHVVHCAHAEGAYDHGDSALDHLLRPESPLPPPPPDGSGYRVFAFPTESPAHGPYELVADPADPVASPNGWHDTNGVPGAEHTITRGNNVFAFEDIDNDDLPGYSPDGGATLLFDFPFGPEQTPEDYLDASITNLFHACNVLHDVLYRYGFDEESGNFQFNNGANGGEGNDEVVAQAQDGSGMNNANFGTPPDGESGRMQMYLWRAGTDSTLTINSPSNIAGVYVNALAGFGPPLPASPLTADLMLVNDGVAPVNNACEPLINEASVAGRIAVVDRGQCTFVSKVLLLEALGAVAVIVVNNAPGAPIAMGGSGGESIAIPSVMISQADGLLIKQALEDGPVNGTLVGEQMEDLRDSGFDNGIIAHEYGHGVSNRLTGGAANVDCLWNEEQMGEGWSDYIGIVLTVRPGDEADTPRGVGTFVRDQPNDGPGIRPAPYTTDMAVNPYTYGDTNDPAISQPHGVGFVWATMLWDATWALVDAHGYEEDLYAGTGGNNMAIQLMMDGLKLQPCNPGFVDGRNAILLADTLNHDAANACLLWNVFAQRGLGFSADQGDPFSRFDQTEAFDLPVACLSTRVTERTLASGFNLQPNPATQATDLVLGAALDQDAVVHLRSVDGRSIRTVRMPSGTVRMPLELDGLSAAIYVVELTVNGRTITGRLVVQ